MELILDHTARAARLWRDGDDEVEIRAALRELEREAALLAAMRPLPIRSPLRRRQEVAAGRGPTGRGATS
jgi:hypothetical protein